MKKLSLLLLFLLHIACYAAPPQKAPDSKSLLWRISGKGLSKPSYLFGTMHVICSDKYVWTIQMAKCLDSSQVVCLEMNLDDPAVMAKVATAMINTSGPTIDTYFTPDQYERLKRYVKDSLGLDIAALSHMNLAGFETLLSLNGGSDCKEQVSYEEKIMGTAHSYSKEVAGLEEPEEQIALLNKIPQDSLIHDILDIINGKTQDAAEYDNLMNAYNAQDLPALYKMIRDDKNSITDLSGFLDERNRKWISRMTSKMGSKSVFFAVGAGHLGGENGVIALLQKAGYTVAPMW